MPARTVGAAAVLIVGLILSGPAARAAEQFPPPDFGPDYQQPELTEPGARAASTDQWYDVILYALALGLATWLALVRRSRNGMMLLSIGALAYFGFYREGCVCPIGSIQNVALAIADAGYVPPVTVLVIFALPILFALFAGRVFCSGVCPLGAIQDVVLVKAVRIPRWLGAGLGVLPWIYLGFAVLFAATDSMFFICRYDPFVPFFRMTGGLWILVYGGALLAVGMVVARPYCRFLCPYGAILGLCSRVAAKKVATTPDTCIGCGLCKEVCPVDAIAAPDHTDQEDPA